CRIKFDYEYFGDIVCFDTTYQKKKKNEEEEEEGEGEEEASSSIASLIYGVQVASNEFRNVNLSRVCRSGNLLAYLLAKYALDINDFSAWIEESPCFLQQALLHDVSSVLIS
ncbi:hypothetical protein SO802_034482, partial [Lithocarpus litseifolius]